MFRILMNEAPNDMAGSAGHGGTGVPNVADGAGANPVGAEGQAVGGSPDGAAGGGEASKSWLESLPDDIKADPSLQNFKDPISLAKSWVNAQKLIGADKVVIPGKDATEEDWANFYNKIGRPESPDKYEIKAPEGYKLDENLAKGLKDVAHKSGMNSKQVNELVSWWASQEKDMVEAAETAKQKALIDSLNSYKGELGGEEKFKATVDKARVAVKTLADEGFKKFLVDTQLGSQPEAIKFFAKLADMMGEDKIRDGSGVPFGGSEDPVALRQQIDSIESKLFSDMNNPSKDTWLQQRDSLYKRLAIAQGQA